MGGHSINLQANQWIFLFYPIQVKTTVLVARPGLVEGMLTFEAFPDATIPKALAFSGESFSEPSLPSKTVTRLGC